MGTGTIRNTLRDKGGRVGEFIADTADTILGEPRKRSVELSKRTAEEDAYDPEKARLEETRRINDSLREYTRSLESVADKLEKDCWNICNENIKNLVADLKVVNNQVYNGRKLNVNLDRLERKLNDVERNINGNIKRQLSRKVSIDDSECLAILKMSRGTHKEKAMKAFSDNVFNKALIDLSSSIREIVLDQCTIITEQIEDRLDQITDSLTDLRENFKEIEQLKQQDATEIEVKKLQFSFIISVCDLANSELDGKVNIKL